jgi:cytochrome c
MRKTMTVLVVTLVAVAFMAALAFAAATQDDAKALVGKAKEFYKSQGKDKALAEFSNPKGQFYKEDLYVYVLDSEGKMIAHPDATLVGKDFTTVKDTDGKLFAVDMVKGAKDKGSGWVDYKWKNPKSGKVDPKTVYFEKVDDVIIASGVYK